MNHRDKGAGGSQTPQSAPQTPQYVAVYTASPTGVFLIAVPGALDPDVGTPGEYVRGMIERGYWMPCLEYGTGGETRPTRIEPAQVIAVQERGDNR